MASTPYVDSITLIGNSGVNQDLSRSSYYTYVNPDNTKLEISGADFFAGVTEFTFKANDIIDVTASDGFATMQFTDPTTVAIRLQ